MGETKNVAPTDEWGKDIKRNLKGLGFCVSNKRLVVVMIY